MEKTVFLDQSQIVEGLKKLIIDGGLNEEFAQIRRTTNAPALLLVSLRETKPKKPRQAESSKIHCNIR